jgi:hypothetical protein
LLFSPAKAGFLFASRLLLTYILSMAEYHMTIYFKNGRFKFLAGTPTENDLTEIATAAHEFVMGSDRAVYWTVNCDLTGEQIQRMARRGLEDWDT